MKWLFRVCKLVVICLCCYSLVTYENNEINIEQKDCYILNDISKYCRVEFLSDNTFKCDISCLSNVINNLILDDWNVTKFDKNDEYIDVIFEKDGSVYRVYYDSSGVLTFVSAPYESRREIVTYMYGRDGK